MGRIMRTQQPLLVVCSSICAHHHPEDGVVSSNLSVRKVAEWDIAITSACAKSTPKPGERVQVFRMKRDCKKGFYGTNPTDLRKY